MLELDSCWTGGGVGVFGGVVVDVELVYPFRIVENEGEEDMGGLTRSLSGLRRY